MNDIDGSDRHLKTEDGQTACGLSKLLPLTTNSASTVPAYDRARHKSSRLGTSVVDAVALGRPGQHPHLHQCASGFRQCERDCGHSLALAQDKLLVPDETGHIRQTEWRHKRRRRHEWRRTGHGP